MLPVAGNVACISATCIPLYPATDGQQTGNNFVSGNMLLVASNKQHVAGNKQHVAGQHVAHGVNAALRIRSVKLLMPR